MRAFLSLLFFALINLSGLQAQYTLKTDSAPIVPLPDSLVLIPEGKIAGAGLATDQFNNVVDSFYGNAFQLENFLVFGHLVDSMYLNHNIPVIHFRLRNGKKANLDMRMFNGGQNDDWAFNQGFFQDSMHLRLSSVGVPGNRIIRVQYLAVSGVRLSDSTEYSVKIDEANSSIVLHYGRVDIPTGVIRMTAPIISVPHFRQRLRVVDPFGDPRQSRKFGALNVFAGTNSLFVKPNQSFEFGLFDHCSNGIQDGDETGVDCGGTECYPCTCFDGIQNNTESDVDCGGLYCKDCAYCDCTETPVCPTDPSQSMDTVIWKGDTVSFKVRLGYEVFIDSLIPFSTYKFELLTNYPPFFAPAIHRVSDGAILETGDQVTFLSFGQNISVLGMQANMDSSRRLIFNYYDPTTCSPSVNDTLEVRLSLLSDSSMGKTYVVKPKICLVTYDTNDLTDVIAYEDILEDVTDTVRFSVVGTKIGTFLERGFKDLDTGELFVVRPDTNIAGAFAQYDWDAPRIYSMMFINEADVRSGKSAPHSVIGVSASVEHDTSAIRISWTGYQGFKNDQYYILRSVDSGPFSIIDSVPFAQQWYKDTAFPLGDLQYVIELPRKAQCRTERGATKRNYNTTRSKGAAVPLSTIQPIDSSLALLELEELELRIFPNPTKQSFRIYDPEQLSERVYIFDSFGKLVKEAEIEFNQAVSMRSLPAGVYFVQLRLTKNRTSHHRLIKL